MQSEDVTLVCRICMEAHKSDNIVNMSDALNDVIDGYTAVINGFLSGGLQNLFQCFNYFTGLIVSVEDNLPQNLCTICASNLLNSCLLLKTCRESDTKLRNQLIKNQTDAECKTCDICGKKFQGLKRFIDHINTHSSNPPYQCKWCKKTFTGDYRRTEHVNRIHYYEQLAEMESQQKEENKTPKEGQKKSEIIVNDTILPSQLTIAAAGNTKIQKQNDETKVPSTNNSKIKQKRKNKKDDGNISSDSEGAKPISNVRGKKIICKVCGKVFRRPQVYLDHLNIHTGNRPYQCKYCGCRYAAKYAKNDHIKRMHADQIQGDEDFGDDDNTTNLPDLKAIKNQLLDKTDAKLHCLVCFKEYTFKTKLTYHYNITHKLKGKLSLEEDDEDTAPSEKDENGKYSCQECCKGFSHRYDLNRHMWSKHDIFPEK